MNAGMLHIYRETLDTSLRAGIDALALLGYRAHEASRAARMFFVHDERTLKQLSAIRNEDEYVTAARESMQELEGLMQADRMALTQHIDEGWDETSLIREAKLRADA
jgi:CPA2 family monovalent cation:H+ antiporter-2/glutathione-regulated potassium-efflux system ancillary protein KefC/glutathione-regulated potassium-efflux system protein KefB